MSFARNTRLHEARQYLSSQRGSIKDRVMYTKLSKLSTNKHLNFQSNTTVMVHVYRLATYVSPCLDYKRVSVKKTFENEGKIVHKAYTFEVYALCPLFNFIFKRFEARSHNCEKRLLASSCPFVRMEQLDTYGMKFDEI
jgi:hypothetical protein